MDGSSEIPQPTLKDKVLDWIVKYIPPFNLILWLANQQEQALKEGREIRDKLEQQRSQPTIHPN